MILYVREDLAEANVAPLQVGGTNIPWSIELTRQEYRKRYPGRPADPPYKFENEFDGGGPGNKVGDLGWRGGVHTFDLQSSTGDLILKKEGGLVKVLKDFSPWETTVAGLAGNESRVAFSTNLGATISIPSFGNKWVVVDQKVEIVPTEPFILYPISAISVPVGLGFEHLAPSRWLSDATTGQQMLDIVLVTTGPPTTIAHAAIDAGDDVGGSTGGGATEPGGVEVVFPEVTDPGPVTALVTPVLALTESDPVAANALGSVPDFPLAGGDVAPTWEITFDGESTGPTQVTLGFDPADLGGDVPTAVLQFDPDIPDVTVIEDVQFDLIEGTAMFEVDGFSTFALAVPEPGTIVLLLTGLLGSGLLIRRRR
jgi:hypothetical protein